MGWGTTIACRSVTLAQPALLASTGSGDMLSWGGKNPTDDQTQPRGQSWASWSHGPGLPGWLPSDMRFKHSSHFLGLP